MKLFGTKETDTHKIYYFCGIKFKFAQWHSIGSVTSDYVFLERNLRENVKMRMNGWWDGYRKQCLNEYFREEIYAWNIVKEKFNHFFLRNINIPQVEFVLTTKCTLRCKNCSNFIPAIKDKYTMSLDEFKNNVDALAKGSNEIQTALLLGGEPLLNKDLPAMVSYIAKNRKFKTIYIVTNATLDFSEELLSAIKEYKDKVRVYISNYSINKELENRLKTKHIVEVLDQNGIGHYTFDDLKWHEMSPCKKLNMPYENVVQRFVTCQAKCVQIYNKHMHICPISTFCEIKKWFDFDENGQEYVCLDSKLSAKTLKKNFIKFYKRDYFQACDWCPKTTYREITPAEQLKEEEAYNG